MHYKFSFWLLFFVAIERYAYLNKIFILCTYKVSVIFLEIESNYTQVDPARELRTAGTVQPGYSPGTEQELS